MYNPGSTPHQTRLRSGGPGAGQPGQEGTIKGVDMYFQNRPRLHFCRGALSQRVCSGTHQFDDVSYQANIPQFSEICSQPKYNEANYQESPLARYPWSVKCGKDWFLDPPAHDPLPTPNQPPDLSVGLLSHIVSHHLYFPFNRRRL